MLQQSALLSEISNINLKKKRLKERCLHLHKFTNSVVDWQCFDNICEANVKRCIVHFSLCGLGCLLCPGRKQTITAPCLYVPTE